nr:DNA helicase [Tanacetum cinerariifolium]
MSSSTDRKGSILSYLILGLFALKGYLNLNLILILGGFSFEAIVFDGGPTMNMYYATDLLRAKQNEIRNKFSSTLYYAITRGDQDGRDAGSRIILSVSFTSGPRPRTPTLGQIFALMKSHLATSQQTAERSKVCKDEDVDAYVSAELPDPIVDPEGLRDQEVQILAVHLENMQHVSSRSNDKLQAVVDNPSKKKTTLTEWLHFNAHSTAGHHLTYLNSPSEFVWYKTDKVWMP